MAKRSSHDYMNCGIPELGVLEDWQALFLLPSGYVDLSRLITKFCDIDLDAGRVLVRASVLRVIGYDRAGNVTRSRYPSKRTFTLSDADGSSIECDAFGSEWGGVDAGEVLTLLVQCKTSSFRNGLYFVSPERAQQCSMPRVDYTGIPGCVSGEVIAFYAQSAISDSANVTRAKAWIDGECPVLATLIARHWGEVNTLFHALHRPSRVVDGIRALAFVKRLCKAEIRHRARFANSTEAVIPVFPHLRHLVWRAWQLQPEQPSAAQLDALRVIVPALSGIRPAKLLLNGDVGCGKTLVYLSIVAGFAWASKPCAVMAPNETLAQQIHDQFCTRFPTISCKYVAGGTSSTDSDSLVWIGTTALLFARKRPDFACVVIDEQHKYSRAQREALLSPSTHLIEATATPIPRSLALALFDGFVTARIGAAPVPKKIRSQICTEQHRKMISALHKTVIENGGRVIYLYAAVTERRQRDPTADDAIAPDGLTKENLRAANAAFDSLNEAFPGKVAKLHGKLNPANAAEAIRSFRSGECPILVASTSVEVGVDVPDVRLMVVSDADRFGIAQLHQLRGRLARNGGEADFVMLVRRQLRKESARRLQAVVETTDGFKIAERDLEIRGFGEVAGAMQSGVTKTTFQLGNLTARDFL